MKRFLRVFHKAFAKEIPMVWSIKLLSNVRMIVATVCQLSVLSMIANVRLSVDFVVDAVVPREMRLLSGLIAS